MAPKVDMHALGPLIILGDQQQKKINLLSKRILQSFDQHLIHDPSQISIFTITNSDVQELGQSLKGAIGEHIVNNAKITTFHSYCCNILRKYGHLVQIPKDFHVISQQDTKFCLEKIISSQTKTKNPLPPELLDIENIMMSISKAKQLLQTFTIYLKEEVCEEKDPEERQKKIFLYYIYSEYETLKTQSNSLDFDDLLFKTYQLLNQHDHLIGDRKTRLIVLDEIHNMNLLQYEIARLITYGSSNVVVTGNPSISSYFLEKFVEDFAQQGLHPTAMDSDNEIESPKLLGRESEQEISVASSTFLPTKVGTMRWILHNRDNEDVILWTELTRNCMTGYLRDKKHIPYECVPIKDVRKGDGQLIEIYGNEGSNKGLYATLIMASENDRIEWLNAIAEAQNDKTLEQLTHSPDASVIFDGTSMPKFSGFQTNLPPTDHLPQDDAFRKHLDIISNDFLRTIKNISADAEKRFISETTSSSTANGLLAASLLKLRRNQNLQSNLFSKHDTNLWKEIWSNSIETLPMNIRMHKSKQILINAKIASELEKHALNPQQPPEDQEIEMENGDEEQSEDSSEEEQFAKMLVSLSTELEEETLNGFATPQTPTEPEQEEKTVQEEPIEQPIEHIPSPIPLEEPFSSQLAESPTISEPITSVTTENLGNTLYRTTTTRTETQDEIIVKQVEEKITVSSTNDEQSMQQILADFQARLANFQKSSSRASHDEEFNKLMSGVNEIQMQLQQLTSRASSEMSDSSTATDTSQVQTEQKILFDDLGSTLDSESQISEVDQDMIPSRHLNLIAITPSKKPPTAQLDEADQIAQKLFSNIKSHMTPTKQLFDATDSSDSSSNMTTPPTEKRFSSLNSPFSLSAIEMTPTKLLHVHKMLKAGHEFWKHSSSGASKKKLRHVLLSSNGQFICFVKPDSKKQGSGTLRNRVDVSSVKCIQRGEEIRQRRHEIRNSLGSLLGVKKDESKVDPETMFSIVTNTSKYYDLEAKTREEATLWADAWEMFLSSPTVQFALPTDT